MSSSNIQEANKAVVGRWFTEFWGKDVNLAVIDERAGSGCLDRFPRTISGVLPGLLSLPHRGWDEGRA